MLVQTVISSILANSLIFAGVGSADLANRNTKLFDAYAVTRNSIPSEDDSDILLYVDSSTGAYLGESVETKVETRAAPIITWIGAMAVRLSVHAATQMTARGISQALVKQVIAQGVRSNANKGAWKYVTGKGKNKITVIVSKTTGKVITVTKG